MCVGNKLGDDLRAAGKSGRKIKGRGGGLSSPLRIGKSKTKLGSKPTNTKGLNARLRSAIKSESKRPRTSLGKLNTNDINLRL